MIIISGHKVISVGHNLHPNITPKIFISTMIYSYILKFNVIKIKVLYYFETLSLKLSVFDRNYQII